MFESFCHKGFGEKLAAAIALLLPAIYEKGDFKSATWLKVHYNFVSLIPVWLCSENEVKQLSNWNETTRSDFYMCSY